MTHDTQLMGMYKITHDNQDMQSKGSPLKQQQGQSDPNNVSSPLPCRTHHGRDRDMYILNLKYIFMADNCFQKVVEHLGLSFQNVRELNRIIYKELPGQPRFKCEEISLGGESFDFHF